MEPLVYKNAEILVLEKEDGWYYDFQMFKGSFKCQYGPFVGPESARESAKLIVDILLEEVEW